MWSLLKYGLIAFGLYTLTTGSFGSMHDFQNGNLALFMSGISKSELDATILEHYKSKVLEGTRDLVIDNIRTTITDLNEDGKDDVIAIAESESTCGTGGCIGSIFLEDTAGKLYALPFDIAVKEIEVLESMTRGMHDLRINGDDTSRLIWDGASYILDQIK